MSPARPGTDPLTGPADPPGAALWAGPTVEQVQYPTRMARRRALAAGQITNEWRPDPSLTRPMLERVEDELARVLDARDHPASGDPVLPDSAAPAARRRRVRRALAALAVVAVAAGSTVAIVQHSSSTHHRAAAPTSAPVQHVIALALARSGQLTGLSLLASGGGSAQQVLVPSRLLLDVPGAGRVPLAQSLTPGSSAAGAALADALEIHVDATWLLDTAALAALVDRVGGVVVDVDTDVTQGSKAGAAVLVSAGPSQRLTGDQAAGYAQLLVGGEPEASRLARQEQVVGAALAALPADPAAIRAIVAALPDAPSGTVLDAVTAVVGGVRRAAATGSLASTVLPVNEIDAGGEESSYGLDQKAADRLVHSRLAGAALPVPPGGRTRVLVQNGVGTPGLGEAARARLVAVGLRYVGGGNVDGFGQAETVVLLPDATATNRARGLAVARALGVPDSALRISDSAPTIADLVVILGADFTTS